MWKGAKEICKHKRCVHISPHQFSINKTIQDRANIQSSAKGAWKRCDRIHIHIHISHSPPPQTTFRKSHKTSIMCEKRKTTTKTPSHTSASRRQHTSGFEDELRGLRENGDFGSAGLSSHFLHFITNCV